MELKDNAHELFKVLHTGKKDKQVPHSQWNLESSAKDYMNINGYLKVHLLENRLQAMI